MELQKLISTVGIDFNQNGTFDEDERSNLATITKDGTVQLTFANSKTYIDPSVNELGVRVRIAKNAKEIESPTGMALSGEVEDFKTQITHPPMNCTPKVRQKKSNFWGVFIMKLTYEDKSSDI